MRFVSLRNYLSFIRFHSITITVNRFVPAIFQIKNQIIDETTATAAPSAVYPPQTQYHHPAH